MNKMKEVIAELMQQRDAIDRALQALQVVENIFVPAATPKAKPAATLSPAPTGFVCAEHPKNKTEFSKKGVCKMCQSERMKAYWSEQRKPAVRKIELVFSKKQRCPKCGLTSRFQRSRVASQDDFWTCEATGCQLKIANYKIPMEKAAKTPVERQEDYADAI